MSKKKHWRYADAGIDVNRIKKEQGALADLLGLTFANREGKIGAVLEKIGHYSGLIDAGGDTALALHTDGVGTKVLIAQMMDRFDTVGVDCVAMNVNDIICVGAEPIAFLDYIAVKKFDEKLINSIAKGLVAGANEASVAIVGGETAVMPDVIEGEGDKAFDLAGMVLGVASKSRIITGDKIKEGDVVIGVESSGIHSNGLSLARKVLLEKHRITEKIPGVDRSVGEDLLEPTRIYVKPVLELLKSNVKVSGLAHITGGAFSKMTRLIRERDIGFQLNNMPRTPPLFKFIQREGDISEHEMYRTFNMGIGFCVVSPSSEVNAVEKIFRKHKMKTHVIGEASKGAGVYIGDIQVS
ncbi:MAG: phosphoribosylformylglycinamidine cyclo-ligase [Thaumarchaeota archaeon]|nr:phosphoribosylformylglycinamidine cyclo-ligase [Nitrososphaerota archaeon]MCL5318301.1 phosphoribosylformylglycinamidine cyclo-ligase [Nitrososphaerota archaeon]